MYGFSTTIDGDMAGVRERVEKALAAEGFGVLTEIDVQKVMKAKLDVDRSPYVILGACNPNFAHAGLEADPDLALGLAQRAMGSGDAYALAADLFAAVPAWPGPLWSYRLPE